jgi:hypothetical protein
MGLYEGSITNYAIYFLFIGLMCIIVLNLFVGEFFFNFKLNEKRSLVVRDVKELF